MMAKKLFLFTTAIVAVGLSGTACSGGGDDDDDDTYTLSSGAYNLEISEIPNNTCWPPANPLVVLAPGVSFPVDIISTNGESFILVTPEEVQAFLPPVEGTIDGNDLAADGSVTDFPVPNQVTDCELDLTMTADGVLTGNDEFDATLVANLTAGPECDPDIDIENGLVPFPTLTETTAGTCSLTLETFGVPEID